jgi:hypothetical protein
VLLIKTTACARRCRGSNSLNAAVPARREAQQSWLAAMSFSTSLAWRLTKRCALVRTGAVVAPIHCEWPPACSASRPNARAHSQAAAV